LPQVEKAKVGDVAQIYQLINCFADKDEMLARSLSEIYENIRDFFIIREGERVIACAALHVSWSDLAEIKSLAVAENSQHQGIGSRIVEACLSEAKELGIPTIVCLTYRPSFFKRFGFSQIDKMDLPRKVWAECYRCPKFPDCGEIALLYYLDAPARTQG
jgi:amino-acid N-acetyltransferase